MAINVTLRQKPISGGRKSLYLDFFPGIPGKFHPKSGKPTRREFLNLHLKKPKTTEDREENKETLAKADIMLRNRLNELSKPEIYSEHEKERLQAKEMASRSFLEFFRKEADKREGSTKKCWDSSLIHLRTFHDEPLKFSDIDERFCNGFRDFLLTAKLASSGREKLSKNTASIYFSKFKAVLKAAHREGFTPTDLNLKISAIKTEETRRNVLTIDEVNALIQTECGNDTLKRAAIFSVYTGLRYSDIQKLTWGEIEEISPGNFVINFKQKKTKGIEIHPISLEAVQLLGERKADNNVVFESLYYSAFFNKILAKWIGLAGIRKNVTFHTFRHAYATIQLTLGTDIYTVSKLLGHRDLKTTQIYAKIIDETKRTAANKIQLNMNNWK